MNQRPVTTTAYSPADIGPASPFRWLMQGWSDLRANPVPGLIHGLVIAVFGWLLLWLAWDRFWLLAGAFSGFLIVSPIVATGLYHVSRVHAQGCRANMGEVLQLWRSRDGRLVRFGLLLALAGTGWVLTSAGLITLLSPVPVEKPADFLRHVVLVREIGLFEIWLLMGALLAAPVFASSVMAIPMLVDTSVPVSMAVAESWRAVASQPALMSLWAVILAMLAGVGMLTGLLGLIVIVPWLAHASWHAYVELSARSPYLAPGA